VITRFTFEIKLNHSANTHGKERLLEYLEYVLKIDQGSDKGGGVVQRLLVGTKRNAYGAQLQNSVHGTFFAATKYRTQPFLTRKIIQNQHYKIQCI
jgi:hypothetical protein